MNENLILLARAVANESEQRGFPHTAEAMRQVIAEMIPVEFDRILLTELAGFHIGGDGIDELRPGAIVQGQGQIPLVKTGSLVDRLPQQSGDMLWHFINPANNTKSNFLLDQVLCLGL